MKILLRKDAIALGLKRYFNGVPCPRGHIAERLVKGACLVCDREDTLARSRVNAEQRAEYARRYRHDYPEKAKASRAAYANRNPHKIKSWKAADQKRNSPSTQARRRRYFEANREKVYASTKAWAKANPAKLSAKSMRYHADKLQRTPPWADHDAILGMYEVAQVFRNVGVNLEVDHEIPLRGRRVSGLHVHDNLRLIHSTANKVKSNHFLGA